jgi:hypothetical protein
MQYRKLIALLLAAALLCSCHAQIDPTHSANMTLYHINPLNISGIENMDLGDDLGDMFFDIMSVLRPYMCPSSMQYNNFACNNREIIGPEIGVTEVIVEVDTHFGPYGTCNICVNGTSPLNKSHTCTGDEYICDCEDGHFPPKSLPCEAKVGLEYPKDFFGESGIGKFCQFSHEPSMCWLGSAVEKVGGRWFSPLTLGKCSGGNASCVWRLVKVNKRVARKCQLNSWHTAVESHMEPTCIEGCTDSGIGSARNTSSKCWVKFWMDAAIGKSSSTWPLNATGGMSVRKLRDAWVAPFMSDDPSEGGCPDVPQNLHVVTQWNTLDSVTQWNTMLV